MFEGIAYLLGFALVKWPLMVALLAERKFDAVRVAYTWPFIAIAGVLTVTLLVTLLLLPLQSLAQNGSALLPILYFVSVLVLLIAFDAWVVGRQARRRFYRDTDDVLTWRVAWVVSLAGNLLSLVVVILVARLALNSPA